tara:strand:- start:6094 stop:7362 length:1269 start_codon:yes stop_codon:yes gene_type:complete
MKKVLIRGPILTRTGYGEQARFAYRALKSRPDLFQVYVIPTNWGHTGWIIEDTEERKILDADITATTRHVQYSQQIGNNPFDISVQVTIPQEWEKLAPVNIGFTAGTETTHISLKWVEATRIVDRIIAVSEHTKTGFTNTEYTGQDANGNNAVAKCLTPVDVVGFPVKLTQPQDVELGMTTDFNFLSVLQWSPRKNLENTIAWFIEEFREDENVGLIVKANIARNCLVDRLHTENRLKQLKEKMGEHKCKLYLLHGNFTDEEMLGLYNHENVHAFINLAHGEGFGLPIFEAALSGLPIVAPNWGGQKDYLTAEVQTKSKGKKRTKTRYLAAKVDYSLANIQPEAVWENVLIPESSWCYPQQSSYKSALRTVYKNHDRFKGQAKKLKTSIENNFSEETQNKKFVDSVLASLEKTPQATGVVTL